MMPDNGSELLKITDKVADLVQRLAGPMAEEVGLMLGDKVRVYRVKNWIRTAQKTERLLREASLSPNAVPPKLLLPIIENSSLEDNDSLQELWAGLLATASQLNDSMSPSFIETLKQLTPVEARHLEEISKTVTLPGRGGPTTNMPIPPLSVHRAGGAQPGVSSDTFERLGLIQRDIDVRLKNPNWSREPNSIGQAIDSIKTEMRYQFVFTKYGSKFLEACQGPKPKFEENTQS